MAHLRLLRGHSAHFLRVQLDRVVSEFGLGHGFESLTANGQIGIAFDPTETVHVNGGTTFVLARVVLLPTDLLRGRHVYECELMSGVGRSKEEMTRRMNECNIERINKAGYTTTEVVCGWAGAIFEVTRPFGQVSNEVK